MLDERVRSLVFQKGSCTHHDHWFMSLFSGEPSLESGMLCYFDGRCAVIGGFPLGGPAPKAELIGPVAERFVTERGAESVTYVGPEPVDLRRLCRFGLRRVIVQRRKAISAELVLDSRQDNWNAGVRRAYQRAKKRGFSSRVRRGGTVRAHQLRIVESFFTELDMTNWLSGLAFAIPAVIQSERVMLVEAWKEGRACGVVAVHQPFRESLVALFLATDREYPGVSDFLYGQMLDLAAAQSVASVNVGPSPTRGHYEFKKKWGGVPGVPPYYLVEWAKGSLARRWFTYWGPRLIRL